MKLLAISTVGICLLVLTLSQPDGGIQTGRGGGSRQDSSGGTCPSSSPQRSNQFRSQTASFLDCIGTSIQKEFKNLRSSLGRSKLNNYLNKEKKRIKDALNRHGCRKNLDRSVSRFLKEEMDASDTVATDITDNVGTLVWESLKSRTLSTCMLNFLRNKALGYMGTCMNAKIPTSGLENVPTLGRGYDTKIARELFEYNLKAYCAAYVCNKNKQTQKRVAAISKIVRDISNLPETWICTCAKEYYKGPCYNYVKNNGCTKSQGCIRNIFKEDGQVVSLGALYKHAKYCWSAYKKTDEYKRGDVKMQDLAKPASNLFSAIAGLTDNDVKKIKEILQVMMDAQFDNGFCSDCF